MTNGTRLTARPTTYKGVQMRSRLEAKYAQWLDSVGACWKYEPDCFADETGQYLPDFRLDFVPILFGARTVYVEIKPTVNRDLLVELGNKAKIIWATDPEAFYVIESASGFITDLPLVYFPPSFNTPPMHMAWVQNGQPSLEIPIRRSWVA